MERLRDHGPRKPRADVHQRQAVRGHERRETLAPRHLWSANPRWWADGGAIQGSEAGGVAGTKECALTFRARRVSEGASLAYASGSEVLSPRFCSRKLHPCGSSQTHWPIAIA